MVGIPRVTLKVYLYSWTSDKEIGVLTCEENITFDGASEIYPVFCIDMTGIIIKRGLFHVLSLESVGGFGINPPNLYFQSTWLGAVFKMAVNNLLIRWPMHEGNK